MRKTAYIFAAVMVVFYFALAYAIAFSPFFASDFSRTSDGGHISVPLRIMERIQTDKKN